MAKILIILFNLLIISISLHSTCATDLEFGTNEHVDGFIKVLKEVINDQTETHDAKSISSTITEMIQELLDEIRDKPQPIYNPNINIILTNNKSIPIPIYGVIKLTDAFLEYEGFDSEIEVSGGILLPNKASLSVSLQKLYLKTYYDNLLKLGDEVDEYIPNKGSIEISIEGFSFNITMDLDILLGGEEKIKDVAASIDLDYINADFIGMLNEPIISNEMGVVLNNELVPYLKNYREEVSATLSTLIQYVLNALVNSIL